MSDLDAGPPLAPAPVLRVRDLHFTIQNRLLFDGLDLTVGAGESVAVMGPSGSGKSTLLSSILGLVKPAKGSILVAGSDVTKLRRAQLAKLRSETIGAVFQSGELLPELSPVDNVALAALLSRSDRRGSFERAQALLDELGVPRVTTTQELSGGEHQRTAVARALINSPTLLLADEPTGALDPDTAEHTAKLLFDLPRLHRCGLLLVTHDRHLAAKADRILHLEGAALVPAGGKAAAA